jgi:SAM-dependent methyltransferase
MIAHVRSTHKDVTVAEGTDIHTFGDECRSFDLVAAFDVLEHIADLQTVIEQIDEVCSPTGYLYFRVPNHLDWCASLVGDRWPGYSREHVQLFTPRSMTEWLERNGFEVCFAGTKPDPRYWLGGMRRLLEQPLRTGAERDRPSTRLLRVVKVFEVLLWPLIKAQERAHAGSELNVIAQRASHPSATM